MIISNSILDLYNQCPKKYQFKYKDNLIGNYTSSALLYGVALDSALNYILTSIKEKKPWLTDNAKDIFVKEMQKWNHQNKLEFFKGDLPKELVDNFDEDNIEHQEMVWDTIVQRGLNSIDVYVKDVLPLIDEVLFVQEKGKIENKDGDVFVFVVDFIAKLKDGRTVLFDNKSSSAKYPKNKVVKSQQLSLYIDQFPDIKLAGYIVLIKNPEREKGTTYQILIDEISEELKTKSYENLETTLQDIKHEKFERNHKSCNLFGKKCEYSKLCFFNNPVGLIPRKSKSNETKETQNPPPSSEGNERQEKTI